MWKNSNGRVCYLHTMNGQVVAQREIVPDAPTATATPTATSTNTPTPTPTNTFTPTNTPTNTPLPSGCQAVVWTNMIRAVASGNSLTKGGSNGWGWRGVSSSGQSISSGNGYVQFRADSTQHNLMAGLSNGDQNQDFTDIDFAAHLQGGGALMVYEGGVNKGWASPEEVDERKTLIYNTGEEVNDA